MSGSEIVPSESTDVELRPGEPGYMVLIDPRMQKAAEQTLESEMAPPGFNSKAKILVAWQMGHELGFTPMKSLQVMEVIEGIAGLKSHAAKALVRDRGGLKPGTDFDEGIRKKDEKKPLSLENSIGYCIVHPAWMDDPVERTFSWDDAKRASLTERKNWKKYPKRMLVARPRGDILKDYFEGILKGIRITDELQDYSLDPPRDVTPQKPTEEVLEAPDEPDTSAPSSLFDDVEGVEIPDAEIIEPDEVLDPESEEEETESPEADPAAEHTVPCGEPDPDDDEMRCMLDPHSEEVAHDWEPTAADDEQQKLI